MSSPARQVRARQAVTPRVRTTPSRSGSKPSLELVRPRKRARRRAGVGFWIMATIVLGMMVVGLAATYALMAQGAFEMQGLSQRQADLERSNGNLLLAIERASSTARIESWGEENRLVRPDVVEIIHSSSDLTISSPLGSSRGFTGDDG